MSRRPQLFLLPFLLLLPLVLAACSDPQGWLSSMWGRHSPSPPAKIRGITAPVNWPWGIAVAPNDDIYIVSTNNEQILKLDHATMAYTVVAGTGSLGNAGDGTSALLATLSSPQAVAVDGAGNIFIADTGNNRIRKVDAVTGDILAFAGCGAITYTGDGGPATAAGLDTPTGIAVDSMGEVFIADSIHNVIRLVGPDGIIHTIAGSGVLGGTTDGPALSAELAVPHGVWVDPSGSPLYFSNMGTEAVCRLLGGNITTVAGGAGQGNAGDRGPATAAQMDNPYGITVDRWGNLYIADCYNQAIRKVGTDGIMVTIAGSLGVSGNTGDGGPASYALLFGPSGIAVDSKGRLFIADTGNMRIRSIP